LARKCHFELNDGFTSVLISIMLFGGGMTDQAFGARTTDVLQKGTVYLASGLFIVTLILSILVGSASNDKSIAVSIDEDKAAAVEEHGAAAAALAEDLDDGQITEVTEEDLAEKIADVISELPEAPEEVTPEAPSEETPAERTCTSVG